MRPALLLCAPLVLAGCTFMSKDRTVDGSSVEKGIRAAIVEQGNQVTAIHCPKHEQAKKGVTFDCTAVVNGTKAVAHVVLTSDAPAFDYRLEFKAS
jgi:hypothetical protein